MGSVPSQPIFSEVGVGAGFRTLRRKKAVHGGDDRENERGKQECDEADAGIIKDESSVAGVAVAESSWGEQRFLRGSALRINTDGLS